MSKYKINTSTFDINEDKDKITKLLESASKDLEKVLKPIEQEMIRKAVIALIKDVEKIKHLYGFAICVLSIAVITLGIIVLK